MFRHVKQLQYTVRVAEPNPGWRTCCLSSLVDRRGIGCRLPLFYPWSWRR